VAVNLQSKVVAVALSRRSKAARRASICARWRRWWQSAARWCVLGDPVVIVVIVVQLVSATRRPTEH